MNGDTTQATGHHFSLPGHSLADLQVTAIEQVKKKDILYRREREEYHIRRFNTLYEGLNKKLWDIEGGEALVSVRYLNPKYTIPNNLNCPVYHWSSQIFEKISL